MVTINTSEDIIEALQEDPRLLRQVRRAIMTDEVLALPDQFADMRETQNSMLETQSRILSELADVRETQRSMLETQNRMLETQNRMLAEQEEMRKDIRALHGMFRRQHDDFANFRGAYAENAARKNDRMIARRIARARGHRVRLTERISYEELSALLLVAENLDTSGIYESSWDTFPNADVALKVTERNRAETQFYIVVEASYTAEMYDLKRATDHAKLLRATTGMESYAIVAGVRLNEEIQNVVWFDAEDFVKAGNDDVALWFKLPKAEMDPLEPR